MLLSEELSYLSEHSHRGSSKEEIQIAKSTVYKILFKLPIFYLAAISSFIAGSSPILVYYFFGVVLEDLGNGDESMKVITSTLIWFSVMSIITGICKFFGSMFWLRVGTRLAATLRCELYHKLLMSDVTFFDKTAIGDILSILGSDCSAISMAWGITKSEEFMLFSQFFLSIFLTFHYSYKLGLILILSVPLVFLITVSFLPAITKYSAIYFSKVASSTTIVEESLASIKTVRSFNAEKFEGNYYDSEISEGEKFQAKVINMINVSASIQSVIVWGAILGALYLAYTLIGKRENGRRIFTAGDVFATFGYMMMGQFGILVLIFMLSNEQKSIQASLRVSGILNYHPSVNYEGGGKIRNMKGEIEFKGVSFKYPNRDVNVLENVSFKACAGKMTALVGHSGSGKSTCIQLIERFYDVDEGEILIDGKNIKDIDPRWLHKNIGLVAQEPTLFSMSIKDNVCYGSGEKTDEEVWNILAQANAKKFVEELDGQLNYNVGGKGDKLSGGQRQRIAIARALAKQPKIMMTDEATSALDTESEKLVQIALDEALKGRTSIVVAHRLSTIKNADVIHVFKTGCIVESGTHDELVRKQGFYYSLVKHQLHKENKGDDSSSG